MQTSVYHTRFAKNFFRTEFESECFKYGKAWLNQSFMMVVNVVAVDQQGNVLRDNMSKDCRSKKTSPFEMAEEDSAES